MTKVEWEMFKELARLWPECQDTSTWLTDGPAPSTRLQDYLEALVKRWPQTRVVVRADAYDLSATVLRDHRLWHSKTGATMTETILDALIQAAKGDA